MALTMFTIETNDYTALGQLPPRTVPPGQFPPRTIDPRQTVSSLTIPTESNCPLDNSPGSLPLRAIVLPPDNYTRTITA